MESNNQLLRPARLCNFMISLAALEISFKWDCALEMLWLVWLVWHSFWWSLTVGSDVFTVKKEGEIQVWNSYVTKFLLNLFFNIDYQWKHCFQRYGICIIKQMRKKNIRSVTLAMLKLFQVMRVVCGIIHILPCSTNVREESHLVCTENPHLHSQKNLLRIRIPVMPLGK